MTTKTSRESLKTRLAKIANGVKGPWWALAGCPVGGWGETVQAKHEIVDALPFRDRRSYSIDDLIDALYIVDHADRYQAR